MATSPLLQSPQPHRKPCDWVPRSALARCSSCRIDSIVVHAIIVHATYAEKDQYKQNVRRQPSLANVLVQATQVKCFETQQEWTGGGSVHARRVEIFVGFLLESYFPRGMETINGRAVFP